MRFLIFLTNFIFLFAALLANAKNQVKCDFESLTQSCALFNPNGDYKINLGDGTFIPNLSALKSYTSKQEDKSDSFMRDKMDERAKVELSYQMDIVSMIDSIPSNKISSATKFLLTNKFATLGAALASDDQNNTQLPLPLNSNSPSWQNVSGAEAKQSLKEFFSPDQISRLISISNDSSFDMRKVIDNAFETKTPLSDELKSAPETRYERVEALLKFTKESLIRQIIGSKPESNWTSGEKALVEKIKSVQYNSGKNDDVKKNSNCQGIIPNAYYEPKSNSINICPGFYHYPDTELISTLAHEIGHSIDPCGAQFPAYSIDEIKINKIKTPADSASEDQKYIDKSIMSAIATDSKTTALPFDLILDNPQSISPYIEAGILTPTAKSSRFIQKDKQIQGYPLSDVYSCLVSQKGGGFRQTTQKQIEDAVDLTVAKRSSIAGDNYNPKKDRAKLITAYNRFPQCNGPGYPTQMREAIADWLGTKVLGDFLKGKQLDTPEKRLGPIGYFASIVCTTRTSLNDQKKVTAVSDIIAYSKNTLSADEDAHPPSKSRIDSILLSDPEIRKAMGCTDPAKPFCEHKISKEISGIEESVRKKNVAPTSRPSGETNQ